MITAEQIPQDTGILSVRCTCGWSADGDLIVVDRWITDFPPIPKTPIIEFYSDPIDPESRLSECPNCGGPLDLGDVELAT